jgi:hypothetical protein
MDERTDAYDNEEREFSDVHTPQVPCAANEKRILPSKKSKQV